MRLRVCTCGALLPQGVRHNHDNERRQTIARAHGLTTAHWQRLRRARLEVDGYACQIRREGCTGRATTVHLDPSLGGDHRAAMIDDCVSACHRCHGAIDAPRATRSPAWA